MTTDPKAAVLAKWPGAAFCRHCVEHGHPIVYRFTGRELNGYDQEWVELGTGIDEAEAWQDAAKRLETP